jgi:hypothetical protein
LIENVGIKVQLIKNVGIGAKLTIVAHIPEPVSDGGQSEGQ